MDTVRLKNIRLWGRIGVFEKEKTEGQPFVVSIEIGANLREAGVTDDLNKTINYAAVFELAKREMEEARFDLIESYAERLASRLLETFERAESVMITVDKPEAPIEGDFESVGITLRRTRDD